MNQNHFRVSNKRDREKAKVKDYEDKFSKLEALLTQLVEKQVGESNSDSEHITNRLSSIEKLIKKQKSTIVHVEKDSKTNTPVIEEFDDKFIPDIDIEGFEVKGKSSNQKVKQDKTDIDDSADLLSRIIGGDD